MDNKEKKTKRTYKAFYLCDYDREEQYLTEMHAKGWAFVPPDENGFPALEGQKFEACEPADVVYKIGFNPKKSDRESYIQMFSDYGWEYCGIVNDFYYFRKNADGVSPEELDIFSDDESRLDMAKKVLKTKLPILLILTVLVLIPQTLRLVFEREHDVVGWILLGAYGVCWVLYLYAFIRTWLGYRRLKEKFEIKDKV